MSNIIEYKDIMAFHPGYYVAEIIDDMEITQEEFATRMGTTGKTISKLVNGQSNLTKDLAQKLSIMLGTGIDVWLNLQKEYDEKVMAIERQKCLDEQNSVMDLIDYSYFVKVAKLATTRKSQEKIANMCAYLLVSDLRVLEKQDLFVNYRTGISSVKKKNIVNANAWIQTALNFAKDIQTKPFDAEKLQGYLPEIRGMTLQAPETFFPRLKDIFSDCGVVFVLLPYLKNSGINGAVKWINHNRVILAMNDRRFYADTFWFSLFHEIKHVLQQKMNTMFVTGDFGEMSVINARLEREADDFARNYLIPPAQYKKFAPSRYTSDLAIETFAKRLGIHPGIVAGRLQHDKIISDCRVAKFKEQYHIVTE